MGMNTALLKRIEVDYLVEVEHIAVREHKHKVQGLGVVAPRNWVHAMCVVCDVLDKAIYRLGG